MKKWKCTICRYIHEGDEPPAQCPICKAPASKFILLEPELDEKSKSALRIEELKREIAQQQAIVDASKPRWVKLYKALQELIVKHHAHPISVHFPNGVLPLAVTLFILAVLFQADNSIAEVLSTAGFFNLFFVMILLPFVLFAGYAEWIKKYNRSMTSLFVIKIIAAAVTTTTCVFNVLWYIADPLVISSGLSWLFILLNVIMLASAGIAGHLGGKLVFKD